MSLCPKKLCTGVLRSALCHRKRVLTFLSLSCGTTTVARPSPNGVYEAFQMGTDVDSTRSESFEEERVCSLTWQSCEHVTNWFFHIGCISKPLILPASQKNVELKKCSSIKCLIYKNKV